MTLHYYTFQHAVKHLVTENFGPYPTGIKGFVIDTEFVSFNPNGDLYVYKGYVWDGPSGPAIDTKNFMRGSLVHDVLYELMRKTLLPRSYRKRADQIMRQICLADGMSKARAFYVYWGVRVGAAASSKPGTQPIEREMRSAP